MITADASDGVYDLSGEVDSRMLQRGLRLVAGDCALVLDGASVHVLRLDEDLGGWASVDTLIPGERHWLVVAPSDAADVLEQLGRKAGEEFTYQPAPDRLSEWTLVRNVVLDDPEGLSGALSQRRPTERHRLAFRGGLPLPAHNAYLAGGAPDLWLPAAPSAATPLRIDAQQLTSGSEAVPLSRFIAPSDASEHQVEYAGVVRSFHTVASGRRSPPAGELPLHVLESDGAETVSGSGEIDTEGRTTVVGARVHTATALILLRPFFYIAVRDQRGPRLEARGSTCMPCAPTPGLAEAGRFVRSPLRSSC